VGRLRRPGKYSDGQGLVLHVVSKDRRNWIFRFMLRGRARTMGLGSAGLVSLAAARNAAHAARLLLAQGVDPIESRRQARAPTPPVVTFSAAAQAYITAHATAWHNAKHRQQWSRTLAAYVEPSIGETAVGDIDTACLLRVLQPLWTTKTETASRVRGRIENILDFAIARGWRDGPNPALWRSNLQSLLPNRSKVQAVEHHAALDWRKAPAFVQALQARVGVDMGAAPLLLLILTVTRSNETLGTWWGEVDTESAIWTIPAERMKTKRIHRVPLPEPVMQLLEPLAASKDGSGLVFPGLRPGKPMAGLTLRLLLQRMGHGGLTVHGFRSTFRNWAADTGKPADLAEASLAHVIGSKVIAAYHRTDLLRLRRPLMDAWAAYLTQPMAEVVPISAGRRTRKA
jgi:integrase